MQYAPYASQKPKSRDQSRLPLQWSGLVAWTVESRSRGGGKGYRNLLRARAKRASVESLTEGTGKDGTRPEDRGPRPWWYKGSFLERKKRGSCR